MVQDELPTSQVVEEVAVRPDSVQEATAASDPMEWMKRVSQFEKEIAKKYQVVSRVSFIEFEKDQLNYQLEEEAGKNLTYKFLSRSLDSLSRIDLIPVGFSKENVPVASRMSDLKLKQKGSYFMYTFDYTMPQNVQYVDLIFKGINYTNKNPKDFVLFILKQK